VTSVATDRRARRRGRIVPDQHGAWGFLLLPVMLGAAAGGWAWALLPIAAAWVTAYPLTWAVSGRLTAARRRERFDRAIKFWGVVAVPLMVASVVLQPWLVWVGLAYLAPLAINLAFARARLERDLRNDFVFVVECTVAVPVFAGIAESEGGWAPPWALLGAADALLMAVVCALTLSGSTLHVKSLIRERANPAYATAARLFSLASVPVVLAGALASGYSPWLAAPFAALALRALFLHDPTWRPSRIGLVELVCLLLVAAISIAVLGGGA
jgi:hypothetical protein